MGKPTGKLDVCKVVKRVHGRGQAQKFWKAFVKIEDNSLDKLKISKETRKKQHKIRMEKSAKLKIVKELEKQIKEEERADIEEKRRRVRQAKREKQEREWKNRTIRDHEKEMRNRAHGKNTKITKKIRGDANIQMESYLKGGFKNTNTEVRGDW